jgi:hypothetical protein
MTDTRTGDAIKARVEDKAAPAKPDSFEDLLVPAIPAMITSLVLEAMSALNGLQKISIAALAAVTLWGITRRRSVTRNRLPSVLRQHWRWAILGIACVTQLLLIITVITFGRPTPTTVTVSTVSLIILSTVASTGRRVPGAIAVAVSGSIIGLCAGIALL